jgi:hypothetical protein
MSAPVTRDGVTVGHCIKCGAQRQFNTTKWKYQGRFFFAPASTELLGLGAVSTVRKV